MTETAEPTVRRALVLGAASQIAPFLATRLAAQGYRGVALSRTPPPRDPPLDPAFSWSRFDLESGCSWPSEWTAGANLFSSVPLWLVPRHISRLAALGVRRVVAFSSTSVSTKAHSQSGADRRLAECLREAETDLDHACRAAAIPYTILRPTLVYGSGRDHNISAILAFVRRFRFFPIAYPACGRRQPVHADDLAEAAVRCLDIADTQDRAFNLPGGETLSYRQMVARLCARSHQDLRLVPIPAAFLEALARVLPRDGRMRKQCVMMWRMNEDLVFDPAEAERVLGYRPRAFLADRGLMDPRPAAAHTSLEPRT